MGAPVGNKNAAGPHGGTPGNVKSVGGKDHVRTASAKDNVKYDFADHQKQVQKMNNQRRESRATKAGAGTQVPGGKMHDYFDKGGNKIKLYVPHK